MRVAPSRRFNLGDAMVMIARVPTWSPNAVCKPSFSSRLFHPKAWSSLSASSWRWRS